jgi:hypothetical protein
LSAVNLGCKKYAELTHNLEKFMFRYKTICGNGHQVLSELYIAEAKKIRVNSAAYSFGNLYAALKKFLDEKANDSTFKVQLKNLKYSVNGGNKTLRYFFGTLCDYYKWFSSRAAGKPNANKEHIINYDNVTLEHIYSQNSMPNAEPEISGSEQHKILNLTILSQDDNHHRGSNKPFREKKTVYQASNYGINQKLSVFSDWNMENAHSWEEYLVEFACKVFII